MRIILAGFEHESNTFAPDLADDAAFAHGGGFPCLCRGDAVLKALVPTANVPAAGFCDAARAAGHTIDPVLWCAACPSGPVACNTYETIANEIVSGIAGKLPADAIYLDLHGAMVAENVTDGEGELIARLRDRVGPDIPIVASLDLHANVTERMLRGADALVAFRTYPHVDMADTGRRALALIETQLAAGRRFAVAWRRLPFLLPICWQATSENPAQRIYARLAEIETAAGLPSLSFAMGFPAADFSECSPVIWAYGETEAQAEAAVSTLHATVLDAEAEFKGALYNPAEAVAKAMALTDPERRPVVIADAQDNPGAGGSSDTTDMLRALVMARPARAAFGLLVDRPAVTAVHQAGVGARLTLPLGGRSMPEDSPYTLEVEVETLSDGQLRTSGPYFGESDMDLGPSACLRHGGVRIVLASQKVQLADLEMFRYVGIEPTEQDILIVKSAIHFRAH
ncbi:M81 family metallopeptidase, partial [Sulfitobacter pontiacus]|uniref:M81 family metallopeptidase n=1 Tax=Sulfitobacter pontiacus TaxID=60137 RepID=UPI003267F121